MCSNTHARSIPILYDWRIVQRFLPCVLSCPARLVSYFLLSYMLIVISLSLSLPFKVSLANSHIYTNPILKYIKCMMLCLIYPLLFTTPFSSLEKLPPFNTHCLYVGMLYTHPPPTFTINMHNRFVYERYSFRQRRYQIATNFTLQYNT